MVASARELKVRGDGNGTIKPRVREMTAEGKVNGGQVTGYRDGMQTQRTGS